jgi:hypothetical protein
MGGREERGGGDLQRKITLFAHDVTWHPHCTVGLAHHGFNNF